MKRLFFLCFCFLLVFSLSVSVVAVSQATHITGNVQIGEDGSCQISLLVTLHLEETATELTFPLPAGAQDVLLDGSYVTTRRADDRLLVQLPSRTAGDWQMTITYRLQDVVSREKGEAQVNLALLSGFAYPIENLEFSVTLPGQITSTPSFLSGYHQEDIGEVIVTDISGNTLHGKVLSPLKDHETLLLKLPVDPDQFPLVSDLEPLIDLWDGLVLTLVLLSILYYLLTFKPQLQKLEPSFCPPDGISAGEVGLCLTGTGLDLTLMVLSWAQLGYLQIEWRDKRHVILHKKMDMDNERSPWEIRAFSALFGNRSMVDGCGVHYARLYRKTALQAPLSRQLRKPSSGRPMVLRLLSCAAGLFSGVKLGLAMTEHPAGQVLLAILCCILCGLFSYFIQAGGKCLPLRGKMPLVLGILCGAVWIGLGVLTGSLAIALPMVIFQLLCGIAIAFGGQRSELGMRSLAQIQGLRQYMVRANTFELQQRLRANSYYFHELALYALALGVDKRFARRFGKVSMPDPGFLISRSAHPVTASQWAALLRQVADALNARQRTLPYRQLTQSKE